MMRTASRYFPLLVLCLALGAPALRAQDEDSYRIGPKDLLRIQVFEASDLDRTARVSAEGLVTFPPLGDVEATGRTTTELAAELRRRLEEKYLQRATVKIEIQEFLSKPISVIGAVKQPKDLGVAGSWTLLEAITAAGGLAENHGAVIYVLRRAENGLSAQVEIPVRELLVRADPRYNIPIFANDLINVSTTVELTVYCLGEVARPGALTFKSTERLTLLSAVASAGGLTDRASPKILIKRAADSDGGTVEMNVDYKRIVSGQDEDPPLKDGDIIVVKESFF
ncbi:MAG: polysaccharide biosynthesis/export family protein [Acidobacteria bacterium]|nr:polysaccharide biosynthesis/export family protein [Acidobacteriota bacterium]